MKFKAVGANNSSLNIINKICGLYIFIAGIFSFSWLFNHETTIGLISGIILGVSILPVIILYLLSACLGELFETIFSEITELKNNLPTKNQN